MGIFSTCLAQGQAAGKMFYIYIQNESGQPFYVKKGSALMSSSPEGYIVIPQLTKGTYDLTIGFPKNEAPEASFKIKLDGSGDKGFLIRKQNKGFELLGLRDFNVIKAAAVASAPGNRIVDAPVSAQPPAQKNDTGNGAGTGKNDQALAVLTPEKDQQSSSPAAVPPEKTAVSPDDSDASDAFSRMLNEITGHTKKTPVKTSKPVKQVPVQDTPAAVAEKPADQEETPAQTAGENQGLDTNQSVEEITQPAPRTVTENKRPSGRDELQFITFTPDTAASGQKENTPQDHAAGQTADQADQAIQAPRSSMEVDSAEMARREQKEARKARRLAKRAAKREQDSLKQQAAPGDNGTATGQDLSAAWPSTDHRLSEKATADSLNRTPMMNSDCRHMAGEDDFQKVRRKMASRSSEEAMFSAAQKYFNGGTCYTTVQIQSLTYLFMTDAYKYKFLELAYPHTADAKNFPSLVKTLGSDYYRGRFKAMVK
jgi:hypothetical protein